MRLPDSDGSHTHTSTHRLSAAFPKNLQLAGLHVIQRFIASHSRGYAFGCRRNPYFALAAPTWYSPSMSNTAAPAASNFPVHVPLPVSPFSLPVPPENFQLHVPLTGTSFS